MPTTATFDRFDPSSYNQSTQTTVYDASGNAQTITNYFKRETTTTPSTWSAYSFIGDKPLTAGGSDHVQMTFDSTGAMQLFPTGATTFDPVTPAGSTAAQTIKFTLGSATTQSSNPFNVVSRSADGKAIGQLQGVTVDGDGTVKDREAGP